MSQLGDIIDQINQLTGYHVPTSSNAIIYQGPNPVGSGSVNQIVGYINNLTGFNIPSSSVQFVSGTHVAGPVILFTPYVPGGTIPTTGIAPGKIIYADHVLRIINALNGVNVDTIIISGSFLTSGSNILDGNLALPFIEEGKYLYTSGGYVIGVDQGTVSSSYATTASYAVSSSYALTASYSQYAVSASYASSSTFADTASYVELAQTASYITSSRVDGPYGFDSVVSASFAQTASYALNIPVIDLSGYATTASFNAFTASYNTGSFTGSFVGEFEGTASWAYSASQALTASYVTGSIFTGDNVAASSSFAETASYALNIPVIDLTGYTTTASFNAFTSSVVTTSSFNDFTASYNTGSFTGSFTGEFEGTASWAYSASQALTASYVTGSIFTGNNVAASSSFAETASYALNIPVIDLGGYVTTSSFNSFTSSYNTGSFTGSFVGKLDGTASWAHSASNAINSQTASYLNTLNQDVILNGNVTVNGTASIYFLNVTYESSSIIYSSGSNQFGDNTNDTQSLIGTVKVSGSLEVTGAAYIPDLTGSLYGTASWAYSASNAINAISSSYPIAVTGSTLYSTFSPSCTDWNLLTTEGNIFLGTGSGFGTSAARFSNFIGVNTGRYTNGDDLNVIGREAAYSASNSNIVNIIGVNAGYRIIDCSLSNFFGSSAGYQAIGITNSNFIGLRAGYSASNLQNSNFIGNEAGYQSSAAGSNFIGNLAGQYAISANNSNFIGTSAGQNATNAGSSNFIGINAGFEASGASVSNFIGNGAGFQATNASLSNFIGSLSGRYATNAYESNFIGLGAGEGATDAYVSNFFGYSTGYNATNAAYSNFIGLGAGTFAASASDSNFLGTSAGAYATNASSSNFIGSSAGGYAVSASFSNFLGFGAGNSATNARFSNFIGTVVGQNAVNASYSTLIGYQVGIPSLVTYPDTSSCIQINNIEYINIGGYGDQTVISATTESIVLNKNFAEGLSTPYTITSLVLTSGSTTLTVDLTYYTPPIIDSAIFDPDSNQSTLNFVPSLLSEYCNLITGYFGIGSNNIVIGTNISLEDNRQDSINIGGIIFGTGSYSTSSGDPFSNYSGSAGGNIGINVVTPTRNFEVSGTVAFNNLQQQNNAEVLTYSTATGDVYYNNVNDTITFATIDQINVPDGSNVFIRPDELEQSKHSTINIFNFLNFT